MRNLVDLHVQILSARLSPQQWSWGNKGSLDGHVSEVSLVSRPGPGPEGGGYPLPILLPGSPPPQPPRDHPHRELPSTTLPPESRTWVDLGPCSGRRGPGGEPPTHSLPHLARAHRPPRTHPCRTQKPTSPSATHSKASALTSPQLHPKTSLSDSRERVHSLSSRVTLSGTLTFIGLGEDHVT